MSDRRKMARERTSAQTRKGESAFPVVTGHLIDFYVDPLFRALFNDANDANEANIHFTLELQSPAIISDTGNGSFTILSRRANYRGDKYLSGMCGLQACIAHRAPRFFKLFRSA
jgi:hypothetical protein